MTLRQVSNRMIDGAAISVLDFGAKGDGITNDAQAFIDAFAYASDNNIGTVDIGSATYVVGGNDYDLRLYPPSNVYIKSNNATLKMQENSAQLQMLLYYRNVTNCGILGHINFDGNRDNNPPIDVNDLGQNNLVIGHGTENAYFESVYSYSAAQDAIYLGTNGSASNPTPKSIAIGKAICESAGRNGMSLCQVAGLTIDYLETRYTIGSAPQAGLDIEPDFYTDQLNGVVIDNLVTHGNAGAGLGTLIHHPVNQTGVTINRIECHGNGTNGVEFFRGNGIKILSGRIHSNTDSGVYIANAKDIKICAEIYNNGSPGILGAPTDYFWDESPHNGPAYVEYRNWNWDFSGCKIQNNDALGNVQLQGVDDTAVGSLRNVNLDNCYIANDRPGGTLNAQYALYIGSDVNDYKGQAQLSSGTTGILAVSSDNTYGFIHREKYVEDITFTDTNIVANSGSTQTFVIPYHHQPDLIASSLHSNLPTGLVYQVYSYGNTQIAVKVMNVTGADISSGDLSLRLEITHTY